MRKLIFILIINNLLISSFSQGLLTDAKNQNDTLYDSKQIEYNYSFTEATKQKIFGNYNQAINLFFRCAKLNPNSAAIYYQLSDIYLIIGNKKRALNFAKLAVKLDRKNIWYELQLAQIYQLNEDIDSTIIIYKRIIKSNPNKYDYQFNLAFLYAKVNKFNKSLKIFKKLEQDYGFNKEIALCLYKMYTIQNDNKSAIKVLKEAIKKYPEEAHFYGLLAEHYASINENDLAIQYYNELLSIDPENEKGILSLIEFYKGLDKYDKAIELANKFICNEAFSKGNKIEIVNNFLNDQKYFIKYQLDVKYFLKNLLDLYDDDVQIHTLNADYFVKTNDLNKAKDEFLLIVNKIKDNYVIWERLFNILISLSDYNTIYELANQAISAFNEKPLPYLYRGISAYQLKKYDVALEVLNKGLKYVKNSKTLELQFFTFLGETYNAIKDFPNSDIYLEKALDIDKQNIYVLNNYSYYLALRSEKLDIALEYIKKCLEIEPRNYTYLDTYGWVLYKLGEIEAAKQILESAISNGGSSNSDILEHYSEILVKLNMNKEALKYYQLIRKLGKDSDKIRSMLNISEGI